MVDVIKWPPVPTVGYEFSPVNPVGVSRSGLTGADYVSQSQVERAEGSLAVIGASADMATGGTMEMLRRAVAGVNLVRIETIPAHFHFAHLGARGQTELDWTTGGAPLAWTTGGSSLTWLIGEPLTGTLFDDAGFQGVEVSGLAPGSVAAYPNEIVEVNGVQARAYRKAIADDNGVARIRVNKALTTPGAVIIGKPESIVYRLSELSRPMRNVGQQFIYQASFRQVFETETDGFVEVDPW